MSAPIGDADAITFAARFHRAVAHRQSVEGALAIARVDMEMNGLPRLRPPHARHRTGVDASTVRLVVPPGAPD